MKPRFEILPEPQRAIWPELKDVVDHGMVLYGGTAIALRLGHRPSVDFDFFSSKAFDAEELGKALPFYGRVTVLKNEPQSLWMTYEPIPGKAPARISFFGALGFGRVGSPEWTDDGVMQIASLDDLMAHKLKVILQRAEAKDYQDIAAMLRAGVSLDKGLASGQAFYPPGFQTPVALRALTWFEDVPGLSLADQAVLATAAKEQREIPNSAAIAKDLDVKPLRLDPATTAKERADAVRPLSDTELLTTLVSTRRAHAAAAARTPEWIDTGTALKSLDREAGRRGLVRIQPTRGRNGLERD